MTEAVKTVKEGLTVINDLVSRSTEEALSLEDVFNDCSLLLDPSIGEGDL